jgi:hypothetical protein
LVCGSLRSGLPHFVTILFPVSGLSEKRFHTSLRNTGIHFHNVSNAHRMNSAAVRVRRIVAIDCGEKVEEIWNDYEDGTPAVAED